MHYSSDIDDAMRNFTVLALVALVSGARAADYTVSFVESFLVQGPAVITGDRSVNSAPPDRVELLTTGIVLASMLRTTSLLPYGLCNGVTSRSGVTRVKWRIRPKREIKEPRYSLAVAFRVEQADYLRGTSQGYVFPPSGSTSITCSSPALAKTLGFIFQPPVTQQLVGPSTANVYEDPSGRVWELFTSGQSYTTQPAQRDTAGWYWDLEVDYGFIHQHGAASYHLTSMYEVTMESSSAVRITPVSVDNQTLP